MMYRIIKLQIRVLLLAVVLIGPFFFLFFNDTIYGQKKISAEKLLQDGRQSFEKKKYTKSIELLKRFTTEYPYEIEIRDGLFLLARAYQEQGEYLEALSYYNRLVSRFPHSQYRRVVDYYMGTSYYSLKIYTRAQKSLHKFIALHAQADTFSNELAMSHVFLGRIAQLENHWLTVLDEYEQALRIINNYPNDLKNDKILMQELLFQMGYIHARYTQKKILAYNFFQQAIHYGAKESDELKFLLRDVTISHIGHKHGIKDISIADIQVDGDDIWIATWNGGVYRYMRSLEKMETIPLPSPQTRSIFIERDFVFIASYDGIFIYNKKNSKITRLSKDDSFFSLAQKVVKDDRYIYFSTLTRGVVQYDYIRNEVSVLNENSFVGTRQVYAIDANHNYLVFGTLNNGAVLFDKAQKETHYINSKNFSAIKGNNIKALLVDGRFLWIAEHLSGVYKYDIVEKKIVLHEQRFHFPSSLLKREKELWVGLSGQGIAVFNEESKKFFFINALDGLTSNEIHILRSEGDYVWIGYLDYGIDILYSPLPY